MNPRFLHYYNQELHHLREVGGEFARDYPKIAGRLGLEEFECTDPYVERLLEGFSFLTARVQMKIDDEFPRFTQHLSELIYPQFLAPTPSMAVVQFNPDLSSPSLTSGFVLPRQSALRSVPGKDETSQCEFRTAHQITMWPLELVEAKMITYSSAQAGTDLTLPANIKAGIRLRLRAFGDLKISALPLDKLAVYLRGGDDMPWRVVEKLLGSSEGVLVAPAGRAPTWHELLPKTAVHTLGFSDSEALLPDSGRSFKGYRLLQEYFAFAPRFLFVELSGLRHAFQRCDENEIEITVLLNQADNQLEQSLDATHFALNCSPVINLFARRADRINLSEGQYEHHVLADRTRPMDLEIYQVQEVTGYGPGVEQRFMPFYSANDLQGKQQNRAFFQVRREKRVMSERQRVHGPRSSYLGSETFITIVDADNAPYDKELRQLGLSVLCTNRDLPLTMSLGSGKTDFILDADAPVLSTRCIVGPSQPRASFAEGEMAWRLINHLSLNYLTLVDTDPTQSEVVAKGPEGPIFGPRSGPVHKYDRSTAGSKIGPSGPFATPSGAGALRELLQLYCPPGDLNLQRQIDGVQSIQAKRITRRMPLPGPIAFGRGLQLTITMDDAAFEGTGAFLLGAVLEQFFAQYVSINSFTETVINTVTRGEIMRWPTREGLCETL